MSSIDFQSVIKLNALMDALNIPNVVKDEYNPAPTLRETIRAKFSFDTLISALIRTYEIDLGELAKDTGLHKAAPKPEYEHLLAYYLAQPAEFPAHTIRNIGQAIRKKLPSDIHFEALQVPVPSKKINASQPKAAIPAAPLESTPPPLPVNTASKVPSPPPDVNTATGDRRKKTLQSSGESRIRLCGPALPKYMRLFGKALEWHRINKGLRPGEFSRQFNVGDQIWNQIEKGEMGALGDSYRKSIVTKLGYAGDDAENKMLQNAAIYATWFTPENFSAAIQTRITDDDDRETFRRLTANNRELPRADFLGMYLQKTSHDSLEALFVQAGIPKPDLLGAALDDILLPPQQGAIKS